MVTPLCLMPIISITAGGRLGCNGVPIGNGVWRVEWSGARCRRVCRSSYSELITCCHSTFIIDKIAWKYRKTANIIEKTSVYHTLNGSRALFHTSKTAKMIKVILITKQHVDILIFIIFTSDSICYSAHMLSPVRLSVSPSVTRVYHRKTVEVRITKFTPHDSPIPLVFAG